MRFGDDLDELMSHHRPGVAFSLGAMGSPRTNFYNDAYRRAGFEQACREVQRLWVEGRRDEAVAGSPTTSCSRRTAWATRPASKARIRAYRRAGVTTLRLAPTGATLDDQLATLGRALDLVTEVDREPLG